MVRRFAFYSILISNLFFCLSVATHASDIQTSALTEKFDLLNKHLSVKMPKGSIKEPRGHSIMGAPESDEDESRIEFSLDTSKFVLMAYDLHSTKGSDFKANVDAYLKSDSENRKRSSEILKSANGIEYVLLNAKKGKIDSKNDANLVESAIFVNSDNSIQQIDIYANNDGTKNWNGAVSFAKAIFQSVASGSSSPDFKKRNITVDKFLGLSVDIPENMSTSTQVGCDFQVFRCHLIKVLGQPPAALGIYIGHHPDKPKRVGYSSKKALILGQSVEWQRSPSESSSTKTEAILNLKEYPIYFLHFFASASSEKDLEELEKIPETLKLDKNASAYQPAQKGYLELMMRNPKGAIDQFKLALESNPKEIKAYTGMAQAYTSMKDNKKAIEAYSQALLIDATPGILMERSWLYQEMGKKEEALQDLNKAISIDSKNADAYYRRAEIYNEQAKFKEALADFSKYLETFPEVSDVRIERAKVYRALGEYQKAVYDCDLAIKDRKSKEAYTERAQNYEKLGKSDLAKSDRTKASKLD